MIISNNAVKKVPIENPSAGLLKIVAAGMEKAVPKNILKMPNPKIKIFKNRVRTSNENIRAFAFLMKANRSAVAMNKAEKFPKNALISPFKVWGNGAI